jgi:hypothetical protein
MPDTDSDGDVHAWDGIRAMYPWSQTGVLHLGEYAYDCLGHYDGTSMIYDQYLSGSCIYDFAEFNNKLYAGAWIGRLIWTSTGFWDDYSDYYYALDHIWELETFKGYLYIGAGSGELISLDASHTDLLVWTTPSDQDICSMVADGDSMLYFGTGGEAGYNHETSGVARVYEYDGTVLPVEIFDADGGDTSDLDHAGIQCLYIPPIMKVSIDIKPGSCPNPLNTKSRGMLPVAICGTPDFDVRDIDPWTVRLEGVAPIRWGYEDVATPFMGDLCDCHDLTGDGYLDMTFKFDRQAIVAAIGPVCDGDVITLTLTGNLMSYVCGEPFIGHDCVWIIDR